jgi:hypothetical protein
MSLYVPTLQWLVGSQGELAIHGVRLDDPLVEPGSLGSQASLASLTLTLVLACFVTPLIKSME